MNAQVLTAIMTEKMHCNSLMNALLAIKAIRPLHPHLVYAFAGFLGCKTKTEMWPEERDSVVCVGADERQNVAYVLFDDRMISIAPPT